jgi:hypothetical protein
MMGVLNVPVDRELGNQVLLRQWRGAQTCTNPLMYAHELP